MQRHNINARDVIEEVNRVVRFEWVNWTNTHWKLGSDKDTL